MEKWQQQYINLLGNEANEEIDKVKNNSFQIYTQKYIYGIYNYEFFRLFRILRLHYFYHMMLQKLYPKEWSTSTFHSWKTLRLASKALPPSTPTHF